MKCVAHIALAGLISLALAAPAPALAREPFTLDAVRAQVQRDYAGVPQLSTQALAARLARSSEILLIDVRQAEEYAVSRIPGAERAEPGMWRSSFMSKFGEKARGKTVIFYCAVGVRSSQLAERVLAALMEQGAAAVYNLDGGIFAWHNEARPLMNAKGATEYVHPFDKYWAQLVQRQTLARKTPE